MARELTPIGHPPTPTSVAAAALEVLLRPSDRSISHTRAGGLRGWAASRLRSAGRLVSFELVQY